MGSPTASTGPTLIRSVRLFDGVSVTDSASVLVRDGLVAEIAQQLPEPPDAVAVDGTGHTLLPGLIDAHTHAFPGRLEQALVLGVTTELDMFADPTAVVGLKERARDCADLADLYSAGTGATAPGGHPSGLSDQGLFPPFPTIGDAAQADAFVAARVAEGSDYLKIFIEPGRTTGVPRPTLDAATVRALVNAGHERGLLVIAHVTDLVAATEAIAAGADGLAHVPVDDVAPAELVAAIADSGAFVVPTLSVVDGLWGNGDGARSLTADPRVARFLDPMSRVMLGTTRVAAPREGSVNLRNAATTVAALHAAGVTILAGTDASNPGTAHGASLHHELQLLVEAGLSPVQALTAATAATAARFGLADRGRIAPGLLADLLLVEGNPCQDITASRAISAVWRRGVRLDREAYAAGLAPSPDRPASPDATTARSAPPPGADGLDAVAATARWVAAERARESARPDRLFDDPLADALAGEPGRTLAARMRGDGTMENPVLAVRTRFIDDALLDAVATRRAVAQAVVLGAGMDSRAYRLGLPADVVWFELDRPGLLQIKNETLNAVGARPTCDRRVVGVDVTDDWTAPLRESGFAPDRPSVWVMEGLLPYLHPEQVEQLLDRATGQSAPGSELLCDPPGRSLIESPWMRPWLARLEEAGFPWHFGTDRPEDLLVPRGWRASVTLMADAGAELGRWPFPRAPRDTPGVPQSFLVHAYR